MALTARKSHRYLAAVAVSVENLSPDSLELDESEVWSSDHNNDIVLPENHPNVSNQLRRVAKKPSRKSINADDHMMTGPKSLPLSIPEWSKIIGGEYEPRASREGWWYDDDEEDVGNDKIPPHEYLARNRVASLSVHEGIGRTLKGRDLSRVRNAIWKKFGFED